MSSSNIINNFNKLLLQENYYDWKYNPRKRRDKNKKESIMKAKTIQAKSRGKNLRLNFL